VIARKSGGYFLFRENTDGSGVSRVMHILGNGFFQKRFGSNLHCPIFATRFEIKHLKTPLDSSSSLQSGYANTPKKQERSSRKTEPQALKKATENFGVNNRDRIFAVRSKSFAPSKMQQMFSPAQNSLKMALRAAGLRPSIVD
jgi:hypothetical protein